jgi:hypothetical protein
MKGTTTSQKIATLKSWLQPDLEPYERRQRITQVQNYLNALSRGGQIEPVDNTHTILCQLMETVVRR